MGNLCGGGASEVEKTRPDPRLNSGNQNVDSNNDNKQNNSSNNNNSQTLSNNNNNNNNNKKSTTPRNNTSGEIPQHQQQATININNNNSDSNNNHRPDIAITAANGNSNAPNDTSPGSPLFPQLQQLQQNQSTLPSNNNNNNNNVLNQLQFPNNNVSMLMSTTPGGTITDQQLQQQHKAANAAGASAVAVGQNNRNIATTTTTESDTNSNNNKSYILPSQHHQNLAAMSGGNFHIQQNTTEDPSRPGLPVVVVADELINNNNNSNTLKIIQTTDPRASDLHNEFSILHQNNLVNNNNNNNNNTYQLPLQQLPQNQNNTLGTIFQLPHAHPMGSFAHSPSLPNPSPIIINSNSNTNANNFPNPNNSITNNTTANGAKQPSQLLLVKCATGATTVVDATRAVILPPLRPTGVANGRYAYKHQINILNGTTSMTKATSLDDLLSIAMTCKDLVKNLMSTVNSSTNINNNNANEAAPAAAGNSKKGDKQQFDLNNNNNSTSRQGASVSMMNAATMMGNSHNIANNKEPQNPNLSRPGYLAPNDVTELAELRNILEQFIPAIGHCNGAPPPSSAQGAGGIRLNTDPLAPAKKPENTVLSHQNHKHGKSSSPTTTTTTTAAATSGKDGGSGGTTTAKSNFNSVDASDEPDGTGRKFDVASPEGVDFEHKRMLRKLCRTTWTDVAQSSRFQSALLLEWIVHAHELGDIFFPGEDAKAQVKRLVHFIDMALRHIDATPTEFHEFAFRLGHKHYAFGVTRAHLELVTKMVMRALASSLGLLMTELTEEAFELSFKVLTDGMLEGAAVLKRATETAANFSRRNFTVRIAQWLDLIERLSFKHAAQAGLISEYYSYIPDPTSIGGGVLSTTAAMSRMAAAGLLPPNGGNINPNSKAAQLIQQQQQQALQDHVGDVVSNVLANLGVPGVAVNAKHMVAPGGGGVGGNNNINGDDPSSTNNNKSDGLGNNKKNNNIISNAKNDGTPRKSNTNLKNDTPDSVEQKSSGDNTNSTGRKPGEISSSTQQKLSMNQVDRSFHSNNDDEVINIPNAANPHHANSNNNKAGRHHRHHVGTSLEDIAHADGAGRTNLMRGNPNHQKHDSSDSHAKNSSTPSNQEHNSSSVPSREVTALKKSLRKQKIARGEIPDDDHSSNHTNIVADDDDVTPKSTNHGDAFPDRPTTERTPTSPSQGDDDDEGGIGHENSRNVNSSNNNNNNDKNNNEKNGSPRGILSTKNTTTTTTTAGAKSARFNLDNASGTDGAGSTSSKNLQDQHRKGKNSGGAIQSSASQIAQIAQLASAASPLSLNAIRKYGTGRACLQHITHLCEKLLIEAIPDQFKLKNANGDDDGGENNNDGNRSNTNGGNDDGSARGVSVSGKLKGGGGKSGGIKKSKKGGAAADAEDVVDPTAVFKMQEEKDRLGTTGKKRTGGDKNDPYDRADSDDEFDGSGEEADGETKRTGATALAELLTTCADDALEKGDQRAVSAEVRRRAPELLLYLRRSAQTGYPDEDFVAVVINLIREKVSSVAEKPLHKTVCAWYLHNLQKDINFSMKSLCEQHKFAPMTGPLAVMELRIELLPRLLQDAPTTTSRAVERLGQTVSKLAQKYECAEAQSQLDSIRLVSVYVNNLIALAANLLVLLSEEQPPLALQSAVKANYSRFRGSGPSFSTHNLRPRIGIHWAMRHEVSLEAVSRSSLFVYRGECISTVTDICVRTAGGQILMSSAANQRLSAEIRNKSELPVAATVSKMPCQTRFRPDRKYSFSVKVLNVRTLDDKLAEAVPDALRDRVFAAHGTMSGNSSDENDDDSMGMSESEGTSN